MMFSLASVIVDFLKTAAGCPLMGGPLVMKELDFAFLLLLWVCRGEILIGKISLACPNELEAGT